MQYNGRINRFYNWLTGETPVAPLAFFRIAFGVMMFAALVRFAANGWIESLFIQPKFFFTFYGFEWIKPFPATGMYLVFGIMMLCALMIAAGLLYRFSALIFFLLFTYVELIDKTNYLNHYYFISIMSGLLVLLPANKKYALDNLLGFTAVSNTVPRWAILTLQLQMGMVYFFAGIAKINADWLLNAMPLRIWLPSKYEVPVIGGFLNETWIAYAFSWCGMLFDVSIAFFLFNKRKVWYAYGVVVVFHVLTAILFPGIGMFPFIMIVCATIFLPAAFHERVFALFMHGGFPFRKLEGARGYSRISMLGTRWQSAVLAVLAIHFAIQTLLPFRYALYPGKLFYTEEGYRFSWRVMLMEKAGYALFYVKDANTGRVTEVNNRDHLTLQQEKQMSTQPDMVLQYAHYLKQVYSMHYANPEVYVEDYVTVNGRRSRLLIDPQLNLINEKDNFYHKKWVIASAD